MIHLRVDQIACNEAALISFYDFPDKLAGQLFNWR
jgi:hypothetical protein